MRYHFARSRAVLVLGLLMGFAARPVAAQGLQAGDRVAICGDSITEQKLYSLFIEDYLLMCQPAANLQALQFGWGGETSWGFLGRMANDTLQFEPNVATTCYGMNDGGYGGVDANRMKMYEDAQRGIVQTFKKAGTRLIIVGSPGVVDSDTFRNNPDLAVLYNKTLAAERDAAKKVADAEGVVFADVFDPMMDVMGKAKAKYGKTYHLAGTDGVHPRRNGHLVMAYAFLKAMGCDGNLGTITVDLAGAKATGSDGHKVVSCQGGTVEVESTRYPFCFYGDPASVDATRGVIEFLPFNQDLNRLTLVVTGATTANLKVTWGNATKTFAAADLAKGINLAAEFLDNPFSGPFMTVEQKIAAKQQVETPAIKEALHSVPAFKRTLPDQAATVDQLATSIVTKLSDTAKGMGAAVQPVRHTLKIEAG